MSQTWVIRDTAPVSEDYISLSTTTISFSSNGQTFIGLTVYTDSVCVWLHYYKTINTVEQVAALDMSLGGTAFGWTDDAYKTVTFDADPTGDLLAWLQANADKTADTGDDEPDTPGETGTMFLSIDGIEIEDLEEGDYTAYEEELGVSERMISGRRIEEIRATIWHVEISSSAISAEKMATLNAKFQASRRHQLFFLPSTGGTELISGWFHLTERPQPALERWWDDGPVWTDYTLHFEEIDGHDPA